MREVTITSFTPRTYQTETWEATYLLDGEEESSYIFQSEVLGDGTCYVYWRFPEDHWWQPLRDEHRHVAQVYQKSLEFKANS